MSSPLAMESKSILRRVSNCGRSNVKGPEGIELFRHPGNAQVAAPEDGRTPDDFAIASEQWGALNAPPCSKASTLRALIPTRSFYCWHHWLFR
jgi:hypothetical protein